MGDLVVERLERALDGARRPAHRNRRRHRRARRRGARRCSRSPARRWPRSCRWRRSDSLGGDVELRGEVYPSRPGWRELRGLDLADPVRAARGVARAGARGAARERALHRRLGRARGSRRGAARGGGLRRALVARRAAAGDAAGRRRSRWRWCCARSRARRGSCASSATLLEARLGGGPRRHRGALPGIARALQSAGPAGARRLRAAGRLRLHPRDRRARRERRAPTTRTRSRAVSRGCSARTCRSASRRVQVPIFAASALALALETARPLDPEAGARACSPRRPASSCGRDDPREATEPARGGRPRRRASSARLRRDPARGARARALDRGRSAAPVRRQRRGARAERIAAAASALMCRTSG